MLLERGGTDDYEYVLKLSEIECPFMEGYILYNMINQDTVGVWTPRTPPVASALISYENSKFLGSYRLEKLAFSYDRTFTPPAGYPSEHTFSFNFSIYSRCNSVRCIIN